MPKDLSSPINFMDPIDPVDIVPAELLYPSDAGTLPKAPLAMPRQVLEHPVGLLARLRPLWDGWVRAHVLGN